jgi:carbonic anhydrase
MDARIDPAQAFGIELGDAHVIRNVSIPAVMVYYAVVYCGY